MVWCSEFYVARSLQSTVPYHVFIGLLLCMWYVHVPYHVFIGLLLCMWYVHVPYHVFIGLLLCMWYVHVPYHVFIVPYHGCVHWWVDWIVCSLTFHRRACFTCFGLFSKDGYLAHLIN